MRSKEQAHDYRYFPEPDLLPLVVDEKWQAAIRASLPELPQARRQRMVNDYGISEQYVATYTSTKAITDYSEDSIKAAGGGVPPKQIFDLVQSELLGRLKTAKLDIGDSPITPQGNATAALMVTKGVISGKMQKDLYDLCFERRQDFPAVYEKEKPQQITDSAAIEKMIDEVVGANPKQFEQYRAGKKTVMGFFVGQVMKASKGQANPQLVNELLAKKLEG